MSETPPEEPQQPTPQQPTPPPPAGYSAPPPGYNAPPPAYNAPPPAYGAAPAGAPLSDSDQRLWATLAHAGGIILGFIAPLVVWLIYKGRGQFVEDQAKEALNFQILVVIAGIVAGILSFVGIGLLLYPVVWIGNLVFCILAAMAANKGQAYRYPLNWRIVK
jgi:hypothetical protein